MEKIDGKILKGMLESASNNLNNHKSDVDALNVFPVPDGDTGTNMSLTFTNGISEIRKNGSDSLSVIAKTLSRGLLMGARGNSGVILSQIFRGFYQYAKEKEELTVQELSEAMLNGSKQAYKAVMRPVEGTILTVIRESSENAAKYLESNPAISVEEYIEKLVEEAKTSLANTPELLPVLKEARVVDSGGSGLVCVLEGFLAYLKGQPVQELSAAELEKQEDTSAKASGYSTEFFLKLNPNKTFKEDKFLRNLEQLGNKIRIVNTGEVVKVHVNTMTPGEVLNLGQRYGEFTKLKIENFNETVTESLLDEEPEVREEPAEDKEFGIITVCAGEGLEKLFTEYRSDVIVSGGQTMNPSTEDFVSAIEKVHAKHIFIFPNNSNIIMAAKQAAEIETEKDVRVVSTVSIPQGISACISFNPDEDVEANLAAMEEAIANVSTGQVTYAIKNTSVDGREIHEGDYMGILNKEIVITDPDMLSTAKQLIDQMCNEDTEIVTLIKGKDADQKDCDELAEYISENYDVDVDVEDGGQPVYSFIIGAE